MANIGRATVILDSIAESRWPMTLTDLATRTGLPRSTVHRVIQALERELYVVRVPDRSGYILGPGLLKFGMNAHLRLLSANRSQLATLARTVNENVELAIFSLHASCIGKAMLAQLPEEQAVALLSPVLPRFTDKTITERAALLAELAEVRRSHVSVDIEEHDVGICAVATAMIGPTGALQAIAIVIPSGRFKAKKELAVEGLKVVNSQVDLGLSRAQF